MMLQNCFLSQYYCNTNNKSTNQTKNYWQKLIIRIIFFWLIMLRIKFWNSSQINMECNSLISLLVHECLIMSKLNSLFKCNIDFFFLILIKLSTIWDNISLNSSWIIRILAYKLNLWITKWFLQEFFNYFLGLRIC